MRNIRFLVLIGVCVVPNLMAQTDRGVITGTVKDVSGAVVPGAQVTAIQTNTNANFKTNTTTSGDFTVPSLPVGSYQVRVENTGFKTFVANKVEVGAGAGRKKYQSPLSPDAGWRIIYLDQNLKSAGLELLSARRVNRLRF